MRNKVPQPNDWIEIWANGDYREATVLAVIGEEWLAEYEMPGWTTALRIEHLNGRSRSVSYSQVPKKWLEAIVDTGLGWIGQSQSGKWITRTPEEELRRRFK